MMIAVAMCKKKKLRKKLMKKVPNLTMMIPIMMKSLTLEMRPLAKASIMTMRLISQKLRKKTS